MKNYKYTGGDVNLGRHGLVKKGQVIQLTEAEAYALDHSTEKAFVSVREKLPEGFPEEPGNPPSGNYCDLNEIRWKTPNVFKDVRSMRRVRLIAAIQQLEAAGFPVPKVDHTSDQEAMRDVLLTIGRFANWI